MGPGFSEFAGGCDLVVDIFASFVAVSSLGDEDALLHVDLVLALESVKLAVTSEGFASVEQTAAGGESVLRSVLMELEQR